MIIDIGHLRSSYASASTTASPSIIVATTNSIEHHTNTFSFVWQTNVSNRTKVTSFSQLKLCIIGNMATSPKGVEG